MIYGTIDTNDAIILHRKGLNIESVDVDGNVKAVRTSTSLGTLVRLAGGFVLVSTTVAVASRVLIMMHDGGWVSVKGRKELIRVTKKFEATVAAHKPDDDLAHYRNGFKAKIGGWSKAVCPFRKSQAEHTEWCQGWDDGPACTWKN